MQILPAPLHPTEWGACSRQHIAKVVDLLSQTHDYVVIDTPGAFNELVATALEAANIILLVTSMDIASIKDTALALEMLRAAAVSEDKVKLIINHSTSANSLRPEDVERVLEYEVFWRIPHDVAVSNSNQLGQPIVLAKPYARARGRSPTWPTAWPACGGSARASSTASWAGRRWIDTFRRG